MNRHTLARAAGIGLALLAGTQAAVAPARAAGPDGGILSPLLGGGCAGRPEVTARGKAAMELLGVPVTGAPAPARTRSFPDLINLGVQDVSVLSDLTPRACAGGPLDRPLALVLDRIPTLPGTASATASTTTPGKAYGAPPPNTPTTSSS
ncbi:hypothetical protein [Streptomyces huiliensis]|uniref:hypothetical protein n=1 Tax=Streptomyces huiliensis TaxID=2876027 RepID=UPI001CBC741E|nr:hypothetical protein [Streptomyces huiliensis]MBZ4322947.1 hypothetical protein [Streptomyces huiliensis]